MARTRRLSALRRDPVYLFGTVVFLLQFVNMLLLVATTTLFLRRVGASWLPHTYVVLNLFSIALQVFMLGRRQLSTYRLSVQLNVGLLLLLGSSIPFLAGRRAVFFFFLFLLVKLHDILCFSYFLTYTQAVFPVREAKRKVSLILGGASVSCIIAGLSVKPLVAWLSMESLFVVAMVALAAVLGLQLLAGRLWPPPAQERSGADEEDETDRGATFRIREAFAVLGRSPLAANLVQVLLLSTFLRYLVDFQYSKAISLVFTSEQSMASFIGVFNAFNSVVIMGAQFALTGRLLAWLKTGGTMALPPLVLLFLSCGVVVWPTPILVIVIHALFGIGFHTATRPAFAILLAPLEERTRNRLSLLSSMAAALGSLASGLVLVGLQNVVGLRPFFLVLAVLYGLYLVVARRLNGNYLTVLERRLASRDREARLGAVELLGFLDDEHDHEHLARLLTDEDPRVRHRALERLGALPPHRARPLVERLLEGESDERNLATIARLLPELVEEKPEDLLLELLAERSDPRVRANALDALGRLEDGRLEPLVLPHLADAHGRVRGSAILALARCAAGRQGLESAFAALRAMVDAPDGALRATAAAVMGELRHPCFTPCLLRLLDDGTVAVRRNALRGLEKLRSGEALPRLRRLAAEDADEEIRRLAEGACRLLEDRKLDEIVRLAGRLSARERAEVGAYLRQTGGGIRLAVLDGLLRHDWDAFPVELLAAVRLCEDDALLAALAACLDGDAPALAPLARVCRGAADGREGEATRLMGLLGGALPHETTAAFLDGELDGLIAAQIAALDAPGPEAEERHETTRRRWFRHLAALGGSEEERPAIAEALEGVVGADAHLASISVDLLEHRLPPALFAVAVPYLEALRDPEALRRLAETRAPTPSPGGAP